MLKSILINKDCLSQSEAMFEQFLLTNMDLTWGFLSKSGAWNN